MAEGIDTWHTTDEYGTPTHTTSGSGGVTPARYGWHGTAERSADTPAGLILMGARLYNPLTGAFTSTDPEYGGNDTTYTYPTDPINNTDLDGRRSWKSRAKGAGKWLWKNRWNTAQGAAFATCVVASAGVCIGAGLAYSSVRYYSSGRRYGFKSRKALYELGGNLAGVGAGGAVARGLIWSKRVRTVARGGKHLEKSTRWHRQSPRVRREVGRHRPGGTRRVTMWRPTMRNYRMNLYNATGSSILAALIARRG